MKLINDSTDPELVALLDDKHELATIEGWVDHLNKDLVDSGYEQYQARVELQDNSIYIKPN